MVQYGAGSSTSSPGFTTAWNAWYTDCLPPLVTMTWLGETSRPESRSVFAAIASRSAGQAGRRGVPVARGVGEGLGGGIHDELRRREVGLARRIRDDGLALGLESLRLGIDLEGRRFGDGGQLAGERSAFGHDYERTRVDAHRAG